MEPVVQHASIEGTPEPQPRFVVPAWTFLANICEPVAPVTRRCLLWTDQLQSFPIFPLSRRRLLLLPSNTTS